MISDVYIYKINSESNSYISAGKTSQLVICALGRSSRLKFTEHSLQNPAFNADDPE